MKKFENLKVGDTVIRMLAGEIPHELKVTELTDSVITCSWWTFDRESGGEIDEDLGWIPPFTGGTGSVLVIPEVAEVLKEYHDVYGKDNKDSVRSDD